jgi:phospholipid/cholesterol/gamma-HCH transport system ATP-binding protein
MTATPANALLEIRSLTKAFGDNRVLDGVDLQVTEGTVTTVIGKSGMGKSVLLKAIVGLLEPDGGEVWLGGKQTFPRRKHEPDRMASSFMFQSNALFDSLTAFENIALPLREVTRLGRRTIAEKVNGLLKRMELSDASNRYPGELSGGMRKRVAFARALVTDPKIVFFDEPTTGLDPERKFGVFDLIAEYRRDFGFTALLVSHDIPEVFSISDRVAWLDNGKIRFEGTPSDIKGDVETALAGFLRRGNSQVTGGQESFKNTQNRKIL